MGKSAWGSGGDLDASCESDDLMGLESGTRRLRSGNKGASRLQEGQGVLLGGRKNVKRLAEKGLFEGGGLGTKVGVIGSLGAALGKSASLNTLILRFRALSPADPLP